MKSASCEVDGCNKPVFRRQWCCAHYTAWKRYGDPTGGKICWRKQSDILLSIPTDRYYRMCKKVAAVISRCTDPNHAHYNYYGGRGVSVYPEWLQKPWLFIEHILSLEGCDDKSLELDRIRNNLGYAPGNLRFVDHSESMRNRRDRERNLKGRFLPSGLVRDV